MESCEDLASFETFNKNSKGQYEYAFNWIDGGYNTEWAKTEKEAIKKAENNTSLKVDKKTIRRVTSKQSAELNRMGNMMSV